MNQRRTRTKIALALATAMLLVASCSMQSSTVDAAAEGEVAVVDSDSGATSSTVESPTVGAETVQVSADQNVETHDTAEDYLYDEADVVEISLDTAITADSSAATVVGNTATIVAGGTYRISGTLGDGALVVDAGDDAVVRLILDGANITNTDGAAVAVVSAQTAVVILADGSQNTLTDGSDYVLPEGEDEPNATLYSAADLTITGNGAITVIGNYNDGIASKDGLVIDSGQITVEAVDDAIRGKDYVVVNGGEINLTAGGDGIKADNEEDADRGFIAIGDGQVTVTSSGDGLQAATDALVTGGTLSITAGSADSTENSARAIQGDVMVWVAGGVITAEATDDAIHSNSTVTIDGGELTLASGDDAIHGDYFVTINGGTITITESFEGIESEVITINDGFIDLTATDDGLNVADAEASTQSAPGGGRGGGEETGGDYFIYINGGTIAITIQTSSTADGDGIDSNGNVIMTGGLVAVSGPTDTRNSAVDASGSFEVSGGTLIGTNIDGRNSEGVGTGSTQASIYVTTSSVIDAGTAVHIQATEGTSLITFVPANEFDVIVFTSPDLEAGETYEVYVGGAVSGDSATGLYEAAAYEMGALLGEVNAR